jgi:hypothetical protein
MRIFVDTLDQVELQTVLDSISGPGIFIVGMEKNEDGTRLVYYEYNDSVLESQILEAAAKAAEQDSIYQTNTKIKMLKNIQQVAAKSRLRKPMCSYSQQDHDTASQWLSDTQLPCPLMIQSQALIAGVTNEQAAQDIISIYKQYLSYDSQVSYQLAQTQQSILSQTKIFDIKTAYQFGCEQLALIEKMDYGFNIAN